MEEQHITLILTKDVLELCPGLPYRQLLRIVKTKEIPAVKWGNRLFFDRDVVLRWRNKQLGISTDSDVKR